MQLRNPPRSTGSDPREPEYRYIQNMLNLDRVLSRPGATIRFAMLDGDARPVVLIHGAGMDHSMFAPQVLALRDAGHSVVAFDVRGHGASHLEPGTRFSGQAALDDLAALLDHLSLQQPTLVGHSLGGNIAQALVRRDPGRAGALVAVDSTWNTGPLSRGERSAPITCANLAWPYSTSPQ